MTETKRRLARLDELAARREFISKFAKHSFYPLAVGVLFIFIHRETSLVLSATSTLLSGGSLIALFWNQWLVRRV